MHKAHTTCRKTHRATAVWLVLPLLFLSACRPAQSNAAPVADATRGPAVVYESVELRRYEGENAHPYIHSVLGNHTGKTVVENQFGMPAYDANGAPLKLDWFSLDDAVEPSYYYLCDWGTDLELAPGKSLDIPGGWSLNLMGADPEAEEVAYVLYRNKQVTFADGTVWNNPHYDDWRARYEGKAVDPAELAQYYPYRQSVDF